jgi:hypothetical protein
MAYEEAIVIGSSAFLFVIFYLSTKLTGSIPIKLVGKPTIAIEILQPMLLIFGFAYSLFHLDFMLKIASNNGQTEIVNALGSAWLGAGFMLTFFVFYFIISFVYNVFLSASKRGS